MNGFLGSVMGHSRIKDVYSIPNGYYIGSVYTCPIHGEIKTWETFKVAAVHDRCDLSRIKPKSRRRSIWPPEMCGRRKSRPLEVSP